MKSSVYRVVGCSGSKRYYELKKFMTCKEARKEATRLNRELAFKLGISYRKLLKSGGEWGRREGIHSSGLSGKNGMLTGF